ncbi:MAG TPA: hypothetical protein G4O11_01935 [Anaerolineae bacterium]|nr:hypothetical protein [Anaerolineae bacterium]
MVELGDGLRLLQQAGATLRAQARFGQELDRYVAVQGVIMTAINRAHSTVTNFSFNMITIVQA